jgi:hypothetical protein
MKSTGDEGDAIPVAGAIWWLQERCSQKDVKRSRQGRAMPSISLLHWQNDRMPRLSQLDAQCVAVAAAAVPSPELVDEDLRGYVMALSAHFQGFCRDLCSECSQIIVSKVRRPALEVLFQAHFGAHRKLDHGNPTVENLRADFKRFGFQLDLAGADPANATRLAHLSTLNVWRNIAAHQGTPTPAAGPLTLPLVQAWSGSCDGLAISLDGIMYNRLRTILKRKPW